MEREEIIEILINTHITNHGSHDIEYVTILAMLTDDQVQEAYNIILNIK